MVVVIQQQQRLHSQHHGRAGHMTLSASPLLLRVRRNKDGQRAPQHQRLVMAKAQALHTCVTGAVQHVQ